MGYDPFSPVAPALINVLCVPASRIKPDVFTNYVSWIQTVASVVTSSSRSHDFVSEATRGPRNAIHLINFDSQAPSEVFQGTSSFEPNRHIQVVVGIVDSTSTSSADLPQQQLKLKQSLFSRLGTDIRIGLLVFGTAKYESAEDVIFVDSITSTNASEPLQQWLANAVSESLSTAVSTIQAQEASLPQLSHRFERTHSGTRPDSNTEESRRQPTISSNGRGTPPNQDPAPIAEDAVQIGNPGKIVATALIDLQFGRWQHALEQFAAGARAARDSSQYAWHAKALEGMLVSMLLHAWADQHFQIPQDCYPTSRGLYSSSAVHSITDHNRSVSEKFASGTAQPLQALIAMLPGLLATIMGLYDRAAVGYDNSLPRVLVCEARVRLAVLLVCLRKHDGLVNRPALADIVRARPIAATNSPLASPTVPLTLRPSTLASLFVESISEAQAQMPIQLSSGIYLAVCQNLSDLQLDRKQGFFMKDILQKLPPVLVEARKIGASEAVVGLPTNALSSNQASDKNHQRIAQGVRALLSMTTQVYGLPDLSLQQMRPENSERFLRRLSSWLSVFVSGDIATKLEVVRLCVRVSDALPDPTGSIKFMSLLLFISRQSITLSNRLSPPLPLIPAEEQSRLSNGINNAVNTAQRTGSSGLLADYWDDFMVRGIQIFEHSSAGRLMPHSSQDLSLTSASGTSKKDPFIYNPFSSDRANTGPVIVVKDEIASFDVVLQNPLEIDIEIESIFLASDGVDFDAVKHSVVVSPLCAQVFTLKGTPAASGSLRITGCRAQVKNCHARDFPIFNGTWKPPRIVKRTAASKLIDVILPESTKLELKVIDPIPSLCIGSTSLVQNSVMLLDGEKCSFSLTLENSSDLPADLILFSYEDSVSTQLREVLATKDLQPADNFELQHQLSTRQAIKRASIDGDTKINVAPAIEAKSKKTFDFDILGKPGLTEASVLIDYAYIGKPRSEIDGTFYTRQLRYTVNVTVNGSIDIPRCSVLSMPVISAKSTSSIVPALIDSPEQSKIGLTTQTTGGCVLQLDLRSICQNPLTVTVETPSSLVSHPDESTEWRPAITLTLLPATISRALISLPKIYIADPFTPIPSLNASKDRQFVVSDSKVSLEADLAAREAFWYREHLIRNLRVYWQEEHGSKKGEINIRRGIGLSPRMIDSLRVEHVQISFSLEATQEADKDSDAIYRKGVDEFSLSRNIFANLSVRIHNLTSEDLRLLLRLQPTIHDQPHSIAMDLSKKFVWSGVLQQAFKSVIKPGDIVEAELGVVALAQGTYEVNATVEEVRSRSSKIEAGTFEGRIGMAGERRIWYARRPCLIHAVD